MNMSPDSSWVALQRSHNGVIPWIIACVVIVTTPTASMSLSVRALLQLIC